MNIPSELVATFLGFWLAINGWQCKEIISLKISVAELKTRNKKIDKKHETET